MKRCDPLNTMVDLGKGSNSPNSKSTNVFSLAIRYTRSINLEVLDAWLQKRASMGEPVLEALSK